MSYGPAGWYSYDHANTKNGKYNPQDPAGEQGLWPGPDAAFLGVMYDELAGGKYGPLNHTHQHVFGYSSGAFMASRLVSVLDGNLKTPKGMPFPEAAAVAMLCGGSYQTYDSNGRPTAQLGLPSPFYPNNGSYRATPSRRHPPALIAQPRGDDFVPTTVASPVGILDPRSLFRV
jgi:hypothetical protein